ncbi:MAG: cysteine desulfurase family protein [Planctomycetota bacterium]|nr:cysteine desulfurase family protein [Planctomycetota bacterium]
MIELDHNATTKPSPGVVSAMVHALTEDWHNPSSVHRAGQAARRAVELARQSLADLLGAKPREVVFTSGGTESIHLALRGTLGALPPGRRTLITSPVEHSAVRDLAETLAAEGARVHWLRVDRAGRVDLNHLAELVRESGGLVSIQWSNNETGAVQPVRDIASICGKHGAIFHCDGTQWVGKEPTHVESEGFDLLTCSPHKFHGPKGVGVLWMRRGVRTRPQAPGTQELGRRGGTENVPGIVGAGVAASEALAWLSDPSRRVRQRALRDLLESLVRERCPEVVVNAPDAPTLPDGTPSRLWNTSNLAFPGLEAEALLMLLSERGVTASAGAACSSGSLEPSPVLLAMGLPEPVAHGSIRLSLGRETTEAQVREAAEILAQAVRTLRGSSGAALPGA